MRGQFHDLTERGYEGGESNATGINEQLAHVPDATDVLVRFVSLNPKSAHRPWRTLSPSNTQAVRFA